MYLTHDFRCRTTLQCVLLLCPDVIVVAVDVVVIDMNEMLLMTITTTMTVHNSHIVTHT